MDSALEQLLSWNFILFCLAISAVTEILRRTVEYFIKTANTASLWRNLLLPIAPMANGLLAAGLIKNYSYPDGFKTLGARLLYGLVAGLLSGLVYRLISAQIKSKVATLSVVTVTKTEKTEKTELKSPDTAPEKTSTVVVQETESLPKPDNGHAPEEK